MPAVRHLVLLSFKADIPAAEIARLTTLFAALPQQIPGITAFDWGTDDGNEDLAHGYSHAFNFTFESKAARDAYLPHPAHLAFVDQLKPAITDVLVLDYLLA